MNYLCVFAFSLLSIFTYAKELHLTPCSKNDIPCLQALCTKFMHAFADGFGEPYNTEPIDPLSLPERTTSVCCDDPPIGSVTYKNIFVRGLKDIKISGVIFGPAKIMHTEIMVVFSRNRTYYDWAQGVAARINEVEGKLSLNLTNSLQFNSDVTYQYGEKSFSGTMEFKDAQVKVIIFMDIGFSSDEKGVHHLTFGPEHYTCEVVKVPTTKLNPELDDALNNDPVVRASKEKYHDQIEEQKNNFACAIVYSAYPHMFELWRSAHKFIPIQDIFEESLRPFDTNN